MIRFYFNAMVSPTVVWRVQVEIIKEKKRASVHDAHGKLCERYDVVHAAGLLVPQDPVYCRES